MQQLVYHQLRQHLHGFVDRELHGLRRDLHRRVDQLFRRVLRLLCGGLLLGRVQLHVRGSLQRQLHERLLGVRLWVLRGMHGLRGRVLWRVLRLRRRVQRGLYGLYRKLLRRLRQRLYGGGAG